jgi:hypothetical protein
MIASNVASISASNPSLFSEEESLSLRNSGEGSGEGGAGEREENELLAGAAPDAYDDELPQWARISRELRSAAEAYEMAAAKASWPALKRRHLPELEERFAEATEIASADADGDEPFDWVVCFARGVEQPFLKRIAGFGFEWFLRHESDGVRLNATKVFEMQFREFKRRTAGLIVAFPRRASVTVHKPSQLLFAFTEVQR